MSVLSSQTLLTPEQLLSLPDQKKFELIDGKLRKRHVSVLSSWVGGKLFRLIGNYVETAGLGWTFPADNGCQCFDGRPKTVRRPDLTFVRAGRLSAQQLGNGWLKLVPDLVVEVVSPHDSYGEVEEKLVMFRKAGVPLIWIVAPSTRTVRIERIDGTTSNLKIGDQLSGEGIIPGFQCQVSEIFPLEEPAAGTTA